MINKVLVADDVEINRDILEEILEDKYEVLTAENGVEALKTIEGNADDLSVVMLDLMMPELDGFGVLEGMKQRGYLNRIPVIVITGSDSIESAERCYDYGVADFVRKPFDEHLVKLRVGNVVDLYTYKNRLEDKVAEQTQTLKLQYEQLEKQATRLAENNGRIIDILGHIVEARSLESGQHIQRVKTYTEILARQIMQDYPEFGLTEEIINIMVPASALHDIGKICIPDSILLKPGKLTDEEFAEMKTHTTRGCVILDNVGSTWDPEYAKMSYEICRYHHERVDGRGYPDHLQGDDIPIAAQIVGVADVYDALVNERSYKDALPEELAFNMIREGKCGLFSEKLIACFTKLRKEFAAVKAD